MAACLKFQPQWRGAPPIFSFCLFLTSCQSFPKDVRAGWSVYPIDLSWRKYSHPEHESLCSQKAKLLPHSLQDNHDAVPYFSINFAKLYVWKQNYRASNIVSFCLVNSQAFFLKSLAALSLSNIPYFWRRRRGDYITRAYVLHFPGGTIFLQ